MARSFTLGLGMAAILLALGCSPLPGGIARVTDGTMIPATVVGITVSMDGDTTVFRSMAFRTIQLAPGRERSRTSSPSGPDVITVDVIGDTVRGMRDLVADQGTVAFDPAKGEFRLRAQRDVADDALAYLVERERLVDTVVETTIRVFAFLAEPGIQTDRSLEKLFGASDLSDMDGHFAAHPDQVVAALGAMGSVIHYGSATMVTGNGTVGHHDEEKVFTLRSLPPLPAVAPGHPVSQEGKVPPLASTAANAVARPVVTVSRKVSPPGPRAPGPTPVAVVRKGTFTIGFHASIGQVLLPRGAVAMSLHFHGMGIMAAVGGFGNAYTDKGGVVRVPGIRDVDIDQDEILPRGSSFIALREEPLDSSGAGPRNILLDSPSQPRRFVVVVATPRVITPPVSGTKVDDLRPRVLPAPGGKDMPGSPHDGQARSPATTGTIPVKDTDRAVVPPGAVVPGKVGTSIGPTVPVPSAVPGSPRPSPVPGTVEGK